MDFLEKSKLFFLGLWNMTEEKVGEFAEEMVKRGKLTAEEAKKMVKDFADKSKDKIEDIQDQASDKFAKSMKELGFVTKEDHEELKKKLVELEKKIASVPTPQRARPATKTTTKTVKKE